MAHSFNSAHFRSDSFRPKTRKTWLTLGLMAGLLSTAVGCSSQQAQQPAAPQPTAQQPDATAQQPEADAAAGNSSRTLDNVQLTPGPDPMAMVLTTRQPSAEPVGSEQIRLAYPSADKAVVTVTKTGLPDDSVAATRTRYEFTPVADSTGATQWQLSKATEQNKCQAQRGSQDWTGELCK